MKEKANSLNKELHDEPLKDLAGSNNLGGRLLPPSFAQNAVTKTLSQGIQFFLSLLQGKNLNVKTMTPLIGSSIWKV